MSDLPTAAELDEITGAAAPDASEVSLGECLLSEALAATAPVATEAKIALVDIIAEAGFRRIGLTSLLDPDRHPAFTDAEVMLRGARRRPGLTFTVVCPDSLAVRRALVAQDGGWGPEEVVLPLSATEADSASCFGEDRAARWTQLEAMVALARGQFALCGRINAAFDPTAEPAAVLEDAERLACLGITRIVIADATGEATPPRVRDLIGWLHGAVPTATLIARFGDARGTGLANTLAAVEAGLTQADCALGGLGGATCTEDLAVALDAMGYATGLDLPVLRAAGLEAERVLGRSLGAHVLRAADPGT